MPTRRVLVADRHADCRETLAELLRNEGHSVVTASSSEDAGRLLASVALDVAIVDERLWQREPAPLSKLAPERACAIVILTTSGRPQGAGKPHAIPVLRKPAMQDELEALLAHVQRTPRRAPVATPAVPLISFRPAPAHRSVPPLRASHSWQPASAASTSPCAL